MPPVTEFSQPCTPQYDFEIHIASEEVDVICRFWCPESRLYDDDNQYADQYRSWVRQGFLQTTPGNAVDYAFVTAQILEDAKRFNLIDLKSK